MRLSTTFATLSKNALTMSTPVSGSVGMVVSGFFTLMRFVVVVVVVSGESTVSPSSSSSSFMSTEEVSESMVPLSASCGRRETSFSKASLSAICVGAGDGDGSDGSCKGGGITGAGIVVSCGEGSG